MGRDRVGGEGEGKGAPRVSPGVPFHQVEFETVLSFYFLFFFFFSVSVPLVWLATSSPRAVVNSPL